MKVILLSAVLLSVLPIPSSHAAPVAPAKSRISLQLGSVNVWLGMPESDALSEFKRAGYQVVNKSDASQVLVKDGSALYSVNFKGDSVVYADREWLLNQKNQISAVVGALGALVPRGSQPCVVTNARVSNPSLQSDRIVIRCGPKAVLIMKGKEPSTDSVLTDVYEFIGPLE